MRLYKALALTAALSLGVVSASFAAPDTYELEPTHTEVLFTWSHFGFSNPSAKFMNAVGTVILDEKNPASSTVNVSFDIKGINSGVAIFDQHLISDKWFNADKFPTATFKSTKVEVTGADTAKVTGDLTIKGITKPQTLEVKLNKIGKNFKMQTVAGFTATGMLKRSDFDLGAYAPAVSDEINLMITAEALKK
jgi:polyisoprenoid-binding protein YceI